MPQGAYAEQADLRIGWLDQLGARTAGGIIRRMRARLQHAERIVGLVASQGHSLEGLGAHEIRGVSDDLRLHLRREGFSEDLVARSFALVREVAGRTLGERHFDVQLIGGRVLLSGMVAEMVTGEGKTLVATLPACTAALAGIPVHIVTVNDYLASRDAEWMGPIYRALGLTVGVVTGDDVSTSARRIREPVTSTRGGSYTSSSS